MFYFYRRVNFHFPRSRQNFSLQTRARVHTQGWKMWRSQKKEVVKCSAQLSFVGAMSIRWRDNRCDGNGRWRCDQMVSITTLSMLGWFSVFFLLSKLKLSMFAVHLTHSCQPAADSSLPHTSSSKKRFHREIDGVVVGSGLRKIRLKSSSRWEKWEMSEKLLRWNDFIFTCSFFLFTRLYFLLKKTKIDG